MAEALGKLHQSLKLFHVFNCPILDPRGGLESRMLDVVRTDPPILFLPRVGLSTQILSEYIPYRTEAAPSTISER